MTRSALYCLIPLLITCIACASSGRDDAQWSRSYAANFDEVWAAAEQAVKAHDLVIVDADRERGRLRASGPDASLELQIEERGELVIVEALAASVMDTPMRINKQGVAVRSVLEEISRVIRGG